MTNTAFSQAFSHYDLNEVILLSVATNFFLNEYLIDYYGLKKNYHVLGGLLQNYWRSLEETPKVTLAQYQTVRGLLSTSKT